MQPVFDKVIVVTFFVAAAIFAADLLTPAGLAEWMLYFIPMLFTPRSRRRYYPLAFATLCTAFIFFGFFYPITPVSMFDFEMGIQRRLLGAFILGGMALVFIERKRSEGRKRESEERFSSFMDNSSALAWIKDSQFRYVYINRLFEEHLNRSLEEIRGRTDLTFGRNTSPRRCGRTTRK